jgi:amphi-Trp domain-containing protein
MSDELFEVSTKQKMSREDAAAKLRQLADQLARHNSLEVSLSGIRTTVKVPAEVEMSVELEVGDENELEIEISW